jgi:hypothetical protein
MKVKELIKLLKKMPQDLEVAVRDHDQSENELSCFINNVTITDFSTIKPNMWDMDEKVVVLSS